MYPLQLVPKPHTHSSVSSPSQSTRGTGTAQGVKASPPHTDRVGSRMSPLPIGSLGRPPRGPTSSNQQLPGPLYRWVPPPPQQAKVNRRCLRRKGRVLLTPDQTQAWGLSAPFPGAPSHLQGGSEERAAVGGLFPLFQANTDGAISYD